MTKNIAFLSILCFIGIVTYGQDSLTISNSESEEIISCNLADIIYDSIDLDFGEKVNIEILNEAFGEKNTYNIKVYASSKLNCEKKECRIEVESIRIFGTDFVNMDIKAQFEKELKEYIETLSAVIDRNKVQDCKKLVYYVTVRLC